MKLFDNKVVVITDGNSGIGKAIAKSFYVQGAKIVMKFFSLKQLSGISGLFKA